MEESPTIWEMLECDGGARWTQVKGSPFSDTSTGKCNFSGCNCGGEYRLKGETESRETAGNWFRRPVQEVAA
jgi:hypothetical protein